MKTKKSLLFNFSLICAVAYFSHFYFNSSVSAAYNRSVSDAEASQLITYYYNGQYDNALAGLDRAIRSGEEKTSRLLEKGHILRQLGEPGKAAGAYREALLGDPDNSAAVYYLALCTYLNGAPETAGKILDGFYKKNRGASGKYSDDMTFLKGTIDFESSRYESAAKTMSSISKDFHASSQALLTAARSFEKCSRPDEAHESYLDAYASDPANIEFLVYAAPFMLKAGDLKHAFKFYYILSSKFGGADLKRIYKQVAQMYEKTRKNEPAGQSKPVEPVRVEPVRVEPPSGSRSAENEILVGLNTRSDGSPSDIRTLKIKSCGPFSIISEKSGKKIFEGSSGKYYELSTGSAGYSIKNTDSGKNFKLGKSRIVISPLSPGDTLLLKGIKVGSGMTWEGFESRCYRGKLIAVPSNANRDFYLINKLSLEEYLLAVLPSEMPSVYPAAALVSQAVCCRSEAIYKKKYIKKHLKYGYHVCDDQDCQMYRGVLWETPKTTAAVNASAGRVLMSEGRICDAIYSDNCGGFTQSSSDITGWGKFDYLSATPDLAGSRHNMLDICSPLFFEDYVGDFSLSNCKPAAGIKNYESRWVRKIDSAVMNECLKKLSVGNILRIIPRKRSFSGHIDSLEVVGTKGRRVVSKELEIRRLISHSPLRSSKFIVETAYSQSGAVRYFLFKGAGFGHGVGFCQNGAHGMASSGAGFEKILAHYFKNARVASIY